MKVALLSIGVPVGLLGAALNLAPAAPASSEPSLASVRAATARFQDINVALAEGYVRDPMNLCDTADMMGQPAELGAMGVHYFRPDLLGITAPPNPRVSGTGTHTDFLQPSILIYEPQPDGTMKLVAVENLVFAKAWHAAGNKERPSYQGIPYDRMADDPATAIDEAHIFEPHYDRHVWLYKENPNGIYAQFNPKVTCEHHPKQIASSGGAHGGPNGHGASAAMNPAHAPAIQAVP
ncbi:MAG TPA: hypothetical protein VNT77_04015 [Allosphingosinicella sp.]|nr:hypothetical protein [Allosphingosinicella sp.]